MKIRLFCYHFFDLLCCSSCHTDADEYGYSLSTPTYPGKNPDVGAEVCCSVSKALVGDGSRTAWAKALHSWRDNNWTK